MRAWLTATHNSYRHQLNHSRKMLYTCDFVDCKREFVRLDLCNRHKERHRTKGSALNRKDANHHLSQLAEGRPGIPGGAPGSISPDANRPGTSFNVGVGPQIFHVGKHPSQSPYTPATNAAPTAFPNAGPGNAQSCFLYAESYGTVPGPRPSLQSPTGLPRSIQTNVGPYGVMSPTVSTPGGYHPQSAPTPQSMSPNYVPHSGFPSCTLPPSDFQCQTPSSMTSRDTQPAGAGVYVDHNPQPQRQPSDIVLLDQMPISATIPVFGSESFANKSPYSGIPEDFVAYLFNTQTGENSPIPQAVPSNMSK